jgi:hypothetical protein
MINIDTVLQGSAKLNLWFKVNDGDDLTLADVPEIIPLRWSFFRDNWAFIQNNMQSRVRTADNPDFLNQQIIDFSDFIDKQRHMSSKINPFADKATFNRFYAIFDNSFISDIQLTKEEKQLVEAKTRAVRAYAKNDFLAIKRDLLGYRDALADLVGLTDPTYNAIYNRSPIVAQVPATAQQQSMMKALNENIKSVDFVLANLFAVDAVIDPFALARANANNPDINIGQYSSGYLARLNYREDLQGLATRYLGSPDKWLDIAIANGLRPPYIDEVGKRVLLLTNGYGNQISIAGTDIDGSLNIEKIFINQTLLLQSSVYTYPSQRTVIDLHQIPVSGEIVITLDGDSDLDKYKTSEQASIRVFLPNTVNSSFFVLIPSNEPLDNSRKDEVPWFMSKSAADEKKAGIDLAIDQGGDLNFSTNGDMVLSYGLNNAIQAIKLKMVTELGTLRYHPDFGLVNVVGSQNIDIDQIRQLLVRSITDQIAADARFARIDSLNVEYQVADKSSNAVAAISIILSVVLAGGSTVIPISFTIAK